MPAAPRVDRIGRDDIRAVDLPRPVIAFEPHDFVRPVEGLAVDPVRELLGGREGGLTRRAVPASSDWRG